MSGDNTVTAPDGSGRQVKVITADDVVAYLKAHPDFFEKNAELAAGLTLPAPAHGPGVIDMQQAILKRLRSEIDRLKNERTEIIANSKQNQIVQNRIQAAVISIIQATTFEKMIHVVTHELPELLDVDFITIAIAAYQLYHGDREGAVRSLVEGGIIGALPEAGLVLLMKDVTRASMELAIEQATGPYKDSRMAKTWPYVQAAIAENQDKIVRGLTGAFSPDDLMDEADQFLRDSSGYVTFPGLEKEVQVQLAQQLFAIRDQVRDAYLTNQYFRKYLELKAWNQEWDRQQQERLMAALDNGLRQDEERARQDGARQQTGGAPTTKAAVPQTPPSSSTADKRRVWQQPDNPSAATPAQTTQQQSSPGIVSRQIETDRAAKQQRDAAEIARLDGMCKCFFETQYQNDCVTGEAVARKQSKEWEGRCEIKEPARYDAEAKKCVGYFVRYWRVHSYDDMKSYKSGYGYLKWPVVPTYCGTRQ